MTGCYTTHKYSNVEFRVLSDALVHSSWAKNGTLKVSANEIRVSQTKRDPADGIITACSLGLLIPIAQRRSIILRRLPGGGSQLQVRAMEHLQLLFLLPLFYTREAVAEAIIQGLEDLVERRVR